MLSAYSTYLFQRAQNFASAYLNSMNHPRRSWKSQDGASQKNEKKSRGQTVLRSASYVIFDPLQRIELYPKFSFYEIRFEIEVATETPPAIVCIVLCTISAIPWTFHQKLFIRFWVMWLTGRYHITSRLADVVTLMKNSGYGLSPWEKLPLCNAFSHWLSLYWEWYLWMERDTPELHINISLNEYIKLDDPNKNIVPKIFY